MRRGFRWEFRPPWAAWLEKRSLGLLTPNDLLRRRLTHGLDVGASNQQEMRRGEDVEAVVTISSAQGLADLDVGLVCTEYYAHYSEGIGPHDAGGRATTYAIAHETWLPIESAPGVQSVRFTIPPDAPFSYEGDCLTFRWEVVARGRRKRRLDAQARHEISVLP
jgi:hypothetical protein